MRRFQRLVRFDSSAQAEYTGARPLPMVLEYLETPRSRIALGTVRGPLLRAAPRG